MMTMTTTMMMKWKVMTRKNLRNSRHPALHPFGNLRHHIMWSIALLACLAFTILNASHTNALEISTPAASVQRKPSAEDCIFYVTVFDEKGIRLPDADYSVHGVGMKKPHWEGYSDARGEFAVRVVPPGDFEIAVKAKGYNTQTKTVASEMGQKLDVVITLVPRPSKKP
jgi:hypothetical protein